MIIGFQGCDSKVGTTMVSQSYAEAVSANVPGSKVICLNFSKGWYRPFTPLETKCAKWDKYVVSKADGITLEELFTNCYTQNNLSMMGSVQKRYKTRELLPDIANNVISLCEEFFTHIVIDFGDTLNFGLSMPGIINLCDVFAVVLGQNEASLMEYLDYSTYLIQYGIEPNLYILNKVMQDDDVDSRAVEKKCGIEQSAIYELPYVFKERVAESQRKTFYGLGDKQWIKKIAKLVDTVEKETSNE